MEKRGEQILQIIINEHQKTAEPVGSALLFQKYKLNISPATIRNEMAKLEKAGYIHQPHTSAGRVPTQKAYQYYVDNIIKRHEEPLVQADKAEQELSLLPQKIQSIIEQTDDLIVGYKNMAKMSAELSQETIFIGFSPNDTYYTGISNLFCKPEFNNPDTVRTLSEVVDKLDDIIFDLFEKISHNGLTIYIGQTNPFGPNCSVLIQTIKIKKGLGLFGLLGPMRMDYQNNINIMKSISRVSGLK